ncbi:MAG: hypothetical protein AAB861_01750, partial [Patescibacteria group bacterium]
MKSIINNIPLPLSVIIAGGLIAGAVYISNTKRPVASGPQAQVAAQQSASLDQIKPITKEDHMRGDPNAPVKIVEYSD